MPVLIALLPLLLAPLLGFAIAEGWLNFGGGEKDLLLLFPYLIWSLCFFLCACVLIYRRWPLKRWLQRAAAFAFLIILLLGIVAYITSWLGVA